MIRQLSRQYIVITLRVIRDEPEGHVDLQFKIGLNGTRPYCTGLPEKSPSGPSLPTDPRQLAELAVHGRLSQPSEAEPEVTPARARNTPVFDRWVHTTDGAKVPSLMRLTQTILLHPGYSGGPSHDELPSVKIGMVVPCRPIRLSLSGSDLRAKFLGLLNSPTVHELVRSLTYVALDASWKSLAGHGSLTLEAAMTVGEDPMEGMPIASALFLPPTTDALCGRDSESATLLLYLEPQTAEGLVPPPSDLAAWHRRFSLALAVPGAFADFLQSDLGLRPLGHRKNQFGVWLKSPQPLTAMVDTQGLRTLPGSLPSNEFIGWAFSAPGGKPTGEIARDILTQLCEYTLHLDSFEEALEAIRD